MEPTPIFPGLEVVEPNQDGRRSIPPLTPHSIGLSSTEVAPYYAPPKDFSEPYFPDPSAPEEIDLPVAGVRDNRNRSWIFIAAVATAVMAIVIGAALGGGLGAALSSCQKDLRSLRDTSSGRADECTSILTTSTSATQTTPTSGSSTTCLAGFQTTTSGQLVDYEAIPSKNVSTLSIDCDTLQKSWQITSQGEKFSALCNVGFQEGENRTDGDGNTITLANIMTLIAYSLADCLEACSGYTYTSKNRDVEETCGSVVFKTDMADNYHANCILLNSTVTHHAGGGACDTCVSATRMD